MQTPLPDRTATFRRATSTVAVSNQALQARACCLTWIGRGAHGGISAQRTGQSRKGSGFGMPACRCWQAAAQAEQQEKSFGPDALQFPGPGFCRGRTEIQGFVAWRPCGPVQQTGKFAIKEIAAGASCMCAERTFRQKIQTLQWAA